MPACASWEWMWTMAQSKAFADASHALNDLSHALALLESENAKLKADVGRMFNANVEKNNEILGLLADNAKLRELLVEVLHELDKVEENVSHGWFWEAARELGVEVGE